MYIVTVLCKTDNNCVLLKKENNLIQFPAIIVEDNKYHSVVASKLIAEITEERLQYRNGYNGEQGIIKNNRINVIVTGWIKRPKRLNDNYFLVNLDNIYQFVCTTTNKDIIDSDLFLFGLGHKACDDSSLVM